jgi:predicted permease
VAAALALILSMLVLGHLSARFRALPDSAPEVLNRFVITISLPAVVLRLVPRLHLEPSLLAVVAVPWVLALVFAALVHLVSKAFRLSRGVTGALLLCVPLGNTSFLGFPMVSALIGPDAVRFAVLYDQLGSFLLLSTYGLVVVARFSGEAEPSARTILLRVLKFPPFLALLVAFLPIPRPPMVESVLERVGDTLVPIAMFAVGLKLSLRPPREAGPLIFGLGAKMILSPLVAFAFLKLVGASHEATRVGVFEAGMPSMITAGALSILAGLAPELAAALVGYGVLLALVTLPVLARLLQ